MSQAKSSNKIEKGYKSPKFQKGDAVTIKMNGKMAEIFDINWVDGGWLYRCHTDIGVRNFREGDLKR